MKVKRKHIGTHTELRAAMWLFEQGYEVFRNLSPCGEIDIVGVRDGKATFFDIKTGNPGGSTIPGVIYLKLMADGSFRDLGSRKTQKRLRKLTPREEAIRRLYEYKAGIGEA